MQIYNDLAEMFKSHLSPTELLHFLPVLLNLAKVVTSKGEERLSPESALLVQTEIERLRAKL